MKVLKDFYGYMVINGDLLDAECQRRMSMMTHTMASEQLTHQESGPNR